MSQKVHLLGKFEAGGHELPSGLRGHLLAYLAHGADWVARERIAFLFWPDMSDDGARRNLRQVLNRMKAVDLPVPLQSDSQRLRWPVLTDLAELRQAVARQDWQAVLQLYRGDLLADWTVDMASGFGNWLEIERSGLQTVRRRAALALNRELAAAGRHAEAADTLLPLLSATEPDEDLAAAFMRSAYLAGERNTALNAFQQLEQTLEEEYGSEPLEATRALAQTIQAAEPLDAIPLSNALKDVPIEVQRPPRMIARNSVAQEVLAAGTPLVLVRGEAGVGKSRLLEELAPGIHRVRCLENLHAVPFQPLGKLLEDLLEAHGVPEGAEAKTTELARLVPGFAPDGKINDADQGTARNRLLEAMAHYLELVLPAGDSHFHLVFDDLQWADTGTLELVTVLAQRGRLRVLGAFRRFEKAPELDRLLSSTEAAGLATLVEIWPLDELELQELLSHLMASGDSAPLFNRWLHQSSGGNVMFALEILKALFEAGSLRRGQHGWESDLDAITHNYSELEQPKAITDVISRRTAHLGEEALRAVQAAAVIGEGFSAALLSAVTEISDWQLLDILEELERVGLIQGDRFRHDLIRQSIYGSLAAPRRTVLHQRTAQALDAGKNPIVVAEHYLKALDTGLATRHWVEAVGQLREAGRYEDAQELLERAASLTREADDAESNWLLKAELCANLRGLARFEESEALAQEILEHCSLPLQRAIAYENLASVHLGRGRLADSEEAARKGVELARRLGDDRLDMSISTLLVANLYYRGQLDEAAELAAAAVALLRKSGSELDLAVQLSNHGAILNDMGRSEEALPLHSEALQIARRLDARRQLVDITLNLLICHTERKTIDDDILELAATTLESGRFEGTDVLRNNYAYALFESGRVEEALAQWAFQTEAVDDPTLKLVAWCRIARIRNSQADAAGCDESLVQVRELADQTEFPIALASAAIALHECGRAGDAAKARELARRTGFEASTVPESLSDLQPLLQVAAGT